MCDAGHMSSVLLGPVACCCWQSILHISLWFCEALNEYLSLNMCASWQQGDWNNSNYRALNRNTYVSPVLVSFFFSSKCYLLAVYSLWNDPILCTPSPSHLMQPTSVVYMLMRSMSLLLLNKMNSASQKRICMWRLSKPLFDYVQTGSIIVTTREYRVFRLVFHLVH